MPPIFESRGGITTSKSIQCEPDLNEAGKGARGASSSLLKDADSTTGSQQIHKLAYDNGDLKCVKCKKPLMIKKIKRMLIMQSSGHLPVNQKNITQKELRLKTVLRYGTPISLKYVD